MLTSEMIAFEQLSGENAEITSISRIGGFLDGYQKAIEKQQWIPCSERLPYSQEDVLCDDDGRVTIGYYTDEEIGWHDTHSYRIYLDTP